MSKEITTNETRNSKPDNFTPNKEAASSSHADAKYVCRNCGSSNVEYCSRVWCNANTDEIVSAGEWAHTWCNNCQENCSLEDYEDYQDDRTEDDE